MANRIRVQEKQMDTIVHTLDRNDPYVKNVICYPLRTLDSRECRERINTITLLLREAGVEEVYEAGEKRISGHSVLGKGWSSIVILVKIGRRKAVAKIRRVDSRRKTLEHEAVVLEYLRPYNIAPEPYFWARDVLVMEYIDGIKITEYISANTGDHGRVKELIVFLKKLFTRAWLLDNLHIDHTELNRPSSHIIVEYETKLPYFIDFESAKYRVKPHNATSIISYIFFRSPLGIQNIINKNFVIKKLRLYKEFHSLEYLLELVDYLQEILQESY